MALRWFLGLTAAVGGAGWIVLVALGQEFRRSFGASPISMLRAGLVPLALLLILASVVAPTNRPLLHVTTVAALLVMLSSAFVLRESVFVGSLGILYFGVWFLFYVKSAWQ